MHANYIRPGGISQDIPTGLLKDVEMFLEKFNSKVNEIGEILNASRIWKQRLVDIGIVTSEEAMGFGFSGPMLRGSGVAWDLRKIPSYELYADLNFSVIVGTKGDCYDRYLVRYLEIKESIKIIKEILEVLKSDLLVGNSLSTVKLEDNKFVPPLRSYMKYSMEALIHHFKLYSEGYSLPEGESYYATEAPKGEFGVYLVSNGTNMPIRCKIKSPGFNHLQSLNKMVRNHMIADLVTIIGTQDIVFGEIDR